MVTYILIVLVLGILLFTIKRRKGKSSKTAYSQGIKNAVSQDGNKETSDSKTVSAPAEFPIYWFDGNGNRVKGVAKMAQGLQVFDEKGNIILDITDGLTKYLGTFDTGTENGSIVNDELTEHFWVNPIIITEIETADYDHTWHAPKFSVSGNTLSWKFDGDSRRINCRCYYGVY